MSEGKKVTKEKLKNKGVQEKKKKNELSSTKYTVYITWE